ncbi:hypothetical protein E2493_02975 [Sphingomonas parva]|uniref:Uncharacterized protein n=1 Tax=Sphingomonas parva TaxID=2555898 RepID=A0A4Y8ZUV3_9SPHN|nr:hypothetical protein [Sphingomonas parva]TFI59813.1 hypothetical protein E2493_02975 [Sphingomonas parva]
MERVILFNVLQLAVSSYAMVRGGAPERIVGLSLLIAPGSTRLLQQDFTSRFIGVEVGVLVVDVILLTVLLAVALNADRFWPLWLAAFQLFGTGAHLVRALDAHVERVAYAILMAGWSYPMILILAVGTWRHVRRARAGADPDWSPRRPCASLH